MKRKRVTLFAALAVVVVLAIGFFVPLGTYTSIGCPDSGTPRTVRLHLIRGETLHRVKHPQPDPDSIYEGCATSARYVQYLL